VVKLIIEDDEGRKTVVPFIRQEITIGRQEGNTIRLTERNVSRHHARLFRQNGAILVEDLGSYNGIRINGERIEGKTAVHDGDLIQIGDYDLAIQDDAGAQHAPRPFTSPAETNGSPTIRSEAKTVPEIPLPVLPPPPPKAALEPPSKAEEKIADEPGARETPEIQPEHAPRLVLLNTDDAGREFTFTHGELRIGRSDENEIAIDDPSLAQTHARLLLDDSGEWQIVDLQSSNGVLINGEPYGKAVLRSGDLLQLGEVKLRFIGPVEAFRLAAEAEQPRSRVSKVKVVFLSLALIVLAVDGLILLLTPKSEPARKPEPLRSISRTTPSEPAATKQVAPSQEVAPPPRSAAVERGTGSKVASTARPAEPTQNAAQSSQLDAKLKAANSAMARRDFQKAVDMLEPIKNSDGSRPPEVDDALYKANTELRAKKKLALAQKSLAAGKTDEALRLLDESAGTTAFAKEYQQLRNRAEGAKQGRDGRRPKETKLALAAKPGAEVRDDRSGTSPPPTGDDPQKLYDEGTVLYRKGLFNEAATALNDCLKVDPNFARCHMVLGATYARLHEPELGAQHYRRFIQLAPSDPDAAKVKVFLEQYESAKGPGKKD